jgi:putative NADPH-quinone reductase
MKGLHRARAPRASKLQRCDVSTSVDTLSADGHEVRTSDLYAMQFDPVSSRHNFITVKDPDYFKPQVEERHASENHGFAEEIEREIQKIEWCDQRTALLPTRSAISNFKSYQAAAVAVCRVGKGGPDGID